mgnify:CR=1 FL=1
MKVKITDTEIKVLEIVNANFSKWKHQYCAKGGEDYLELKSNEYLDVIDLHKFLNNLNVVLTESELERLLSDADNHSRAKKLIKGEVCRYDFVGMEGLD